MVPSFRVESFPGVFHRRLALGGPCPPPSSEPQAPRPSARSGGKDNAIVFFHDVSPFRFGASVSQSVRPGSTFGFIIEIVTENLWFVKLICAILIFQNRINPVITDRHIWQEKGGRVHGPGAASILLSVANHLSFTEGRRGSM